MPDPKQVTVWIEQLGSNDFQERETANKQLVGVAAAARGQLAAAVTKADLPEVRNRLKGNLAPPGEGSPVTGDLMRSIRAVETLETIRTTEARILLRAIAGGAAESRLTRTAAAALKRIDTEKEQK